LARASSLRDNAVFRSRAVNGIVGQDARPTMNGNDNGNDNGSLTR